MDTLTNSKDLLNISLAVGVVVLTIFLAMALFYLVLVLRDTSKISKEARGAMGEPMRIVSMLMEKLSKFVEEKLKK